MHNFVRTMCESKVCYVWDENLINQCNRLPATVDRAITVHSLIHAYNLHEKLKVVQSSPASYNDLKEFHSEEYLEHLKKFITFSEEDEDYVPNTQDENFGIGYDCCPMSNMFELVCAIAGGSVTAARCLMLGIADVAINWCGGWHHARRSSAHGFCYVNDIVIAIEKLRKKFPKVLYIDLDIHHGDGVQEAYSTSKSVFTLSFHKYEPGFYPGSGGIDEIGSLDGKGYSSNVPLHAGYSDDTIEYLFDNVFESVYTCFGPQAIVVQCGADALSQDLLGDARLTANGYQACLRRVLDKRVPTLLLGGGGYNPTNAARLWASLTALTVGVTLDESIPEHKYWPNQPGFTLTIYPTLKKDENTQCYLDECITTIQGNIRKYLQKNETGNNQNEVCIVKNSLGKETVCYKKYANQNVLSVETEDVYEFVD